MHSVYNQDNFLPTATGLFIEITDS